MKSCTKCGENLQDGSKFCSSCGATVTLPEPSHCLNCNAELASNAKFCTECGTPVSENRIGGTKEHQTTIETEQETDQNMKNSQSLPSEQHQTEQDQKSDALRMLQLKVDDLQNEIKKDDDLMTMQLCWQELVVYTSEICQILGLTENQVSEIADPDAKPMMNLDEVDKVTMNKLPTWLKQKGWVR